MGRSTSRRLVGLLAVACFCVCQSARDEGDAGSADALAKEAGTRAVAGPKWIRDYEQGLKKARDEKKDLFLVLTGHGWCANCELLDSEVFRQPEFVYKTAKSFVFVELDFNYGDSAAEKKRESVERDLQKRYLAPGVPTVFLLDADAVPYGIVTGYEAGFGVPKYLALIQEARAARTVRDQNFAAARTAAGHERAELLHAGLQAVGGQLGTFEKRGDDPILAFYPTVVAEIQKLEPADSPVRVVYETRRKERDARQAMDESIFQKLRDFDRKRDYKGAIQFLDARLKEPATPAVRWRLRTARHVYLEWDDQYAAALADARQLQASGDRSPDEREWLLQRESFNLFNLGRVDEARSQCDRRIHDAKSPAKKLSLLGWKAANAHESPRSFARGSHPGVARIRPRPNLGRSSGLPRRRFRDGCSSAKAATARRSHSLRSFCSRRRKTRLPCSMRPSATSSWGTKRRPAGEFARPKPPFRQIPRGRPISPRSNATARESRSFGNNSAKRANEAAPRSKGFASRRPTLLLLVQQFGQLRIQRVAAELLGHNHPLLVENVNRRPTQDVPVADDRAVLAVEPAGPIHFVLGGRLLGLFERFVVANAQQCERPRIVLLNQPPFLRDHCHTGPAAGEPERKDDDLAAVPAELKRPTVQVLARSGVVLGDQFLELGQTVGFGRRAGLSQQAEQARRN